MNPRSRKEKNKSTNKTAAVIFVLAFVFCSIFIVAKTNVQVPAAGKAAMAFLSPFQKGFSSLGGGVSDLKDSVEEMENLQTEVVQLRAEVEQLRAQNLNASEAISENQRLRSLLGYKQSATQFDVVAASIIAMACKCVMSPASILMIHNVICVDYGDKQSKTKTAKDLGAHDRGIAAVYAAKTGLSIDEIAKMMDKETYLDAQTALEKGFVDGILTDIDTAPRVAAAVGNGLLPQDVINELRQLKRKDVKNQPTDGVSVEQLKARLNLLRR